MLKSALKFTFSTLSSVLIAACTFPVSAAANSLVRPYQTFDSYTTINPINGDATDIYFPTTNTTPNNRLPADNLSVVLLLQGALVDKSFYSDYASQVARYGFVVAVPNHFQMVPGFGDVLAADTSQIQATLDQFADEVNREDSPLKGKVNLQKLGLLGHSLGGAVGLSAVGDVCVPPFCLQPFKRPEALLGGAFFGANLRDQNDIFLPIANAGIGVALIQGEQDGRALPLNAERTFDEIQTPPKALITLVGVNHFGITNVMTPTGAIPDLNPQTLAQAESIETVARWSGLFLRGTVLNDQAALDYIFNTGEQLDPVVVRVEGQAAAVPEPASSAGLASVGLVSFIVLKRRTRRIC